MTREEVSANSQSKKEAIETLCRQMQMVVTAEQVITEGGIIRTMVFYNDIEKYPIDDPKLNEELIQKVPDLRE
jgi:hypothetical protein